MNYEEYFSHFKNHSDFEEKEISYNFCLHLASLFPSQKILSSIIDTRNESLDFDNLCILLYQILQEKSIL